MSSMKSKQTISLREKLRARMRKEVPVSREQELARKIEVLTSEAQTLHTDGSGLHQRAETYRTRASTALPPSAAPPDREALFRASGKTAPPSEYEAQLKAYNELLEDWNAYQQEVKTFGKRIDRYSSSLKTARKKGGSKSRKPFSTTDHEFESLNNALHNLREQKAEIDRAIAKVSLPIRKKIM